MLGHPDERFGYRLWDPVNKKIVRSRDVVFFEDETIEDIVKQKKQATTPQVVDMDQIPSLVVHGNHGGDDDTEGASSSQGDDQSSEDEDADVDDTLEEPQQEQLRRTSRVRRPSSRYPPHEYLLLTDAGELSCYEEAMSDEHKNHWLEAMEDEMNSLHENNTFELVKLPKGKKALKNKWVYRLKSEENSSQPRYKARLVVKGFAQKQGIDFDEIFSPVVKMSSIRVVLGMAATMDLEVEQLDVKTTFLHGDLEEEIYMEQPEGFAIAGKEHLVCKLNKSLYGLKQAPR